jgi:hypothetical protein
MITQRLAERNMTVEDMIRTGQDTKTAGNAVTAFATGQKGDLTRSFNVTTDHLSQLRIAAVALKNGNYPLLNKWAQSIAQATGSAAPTTFDAIKGIVADEVNKAVMGSGGALADRQDLKESLQRASAPAQLAGVLNGYIGLMGGQLRGLALQYKNSTGRDDFGRFLSPRTASATGFKGGSSALPLPGGAASAASASNAASAGASIPPGAVYLGTHQGRPVYRVNGKNWTP